MQVLTSGWAYKVVGAFTAALTASVVSVIAQADCDGSQVPADRAQCSGRQSAVVPPFTLQQHLEFSMRITGKERLSFTLLGDPPALNGVLTSTLDRRNQLYEQYTAYANAGFMEEANKFIPQIEALDKALDFLEANQALNDAINYNDPRRLSQVLSQATELGPVNVVAQRKGDEVVFTINTPGGQPIRPEYTEMSRDQLEHIVIDLVSPPMPDQDQVSGIASVVDGDTLEIRGVRIRLHGVDAPESQQTCTGVLGDSWRCGQQAALALADRIGRRPVSCEVRDVDRYDRKVAVCEQRGEDLNRWLVNSGWAVAYRQYSPDYISAEDYARRARRNIWSGQFIMPWDWRRGQRLQ